MLLKTFTLVLFFICSIQTVFSSSSLDSLVNHLENTMTKRAIYDEIKEKRIQALIQKASINNEIKEVFYINNIIIEEYQFYNFDKALNYIEKNIEIAENQQEISLIDKTKLKLGKLLLDSGRYKESIDALNEISRTRLPEKLINEYYIAYKEGYSGLTYNTTVKKSKERYSLLYNAYQDSLYSRLNPNSEESLRLKEKQLRDGRKLDLALEINSKRLKNASIGMRSYSLITFERSLLYELQNDLINQKKYLILSAISDIQASVKDNASMGELAKIMFRENDIDRAYKYINFSFDDASFYNSQLRYVNIANSLPMITNAYEIKSTAQKNKLKNYLLFISILAVILFASIYLVYQQVKKLSVARNKLKLVNDELKTVNEKLNTSNDDLKKLYGELSESDRIKENYIGTFLNLYSEYISKLDVYRKLVRKYVKANQMNSLLELSKSKQLIDEELEIFNKNFDNSFLHIYPDFLKSINKLLQPEKQIILNNSTKLTTELRILALIKLGITSSSRISKILRYSVNTIYNYRANIKSASIEKENFEEMVKKIM